MPPVMLVPTTPPPRPVDPTLVAAPIDLAGSGARAVEAPVSGTLETGALDALPAPGAGLPASTETGAGAEPASAAIPAPVAPDSAQGPAQGFPVTSIVLGGTPGSGSGSLAETSSGEHNLFVYRGVAEAVSSSGTQFDYKVPKDAFGHTDSDAVVKLDAMQGDGSPLPAWLKFDPFTGQFSGEPPAAGLSTLEVMVVARDAVGREASVVFRPILSGEAGATAAGPAAGAPLGLRGALSELPPAGAGQASSRGQAALPDQSGESVDRGFPVARVPAAAAQEPGAPATPNLFVFQGIAEAARSSDGKLEFKVPGDAFGHTDPNAVVKLEARLVDGAPLPAWLKFDPDSGQFSGEPPASAPTALEVVLVARDAEGREASLVFRPVVAPALSAPTGASAGEPAALGRDLKLISPEFERQLVAGGVLPAAPGSLEALKLIPAPAAGTVELAAQAAAQDRMKLEAAQGFPVARMVARADAARDQGSAGEQSLFVFRGVSKAVSASETLFAFKVPRDAFGHTDAGAEVKLEATLADGSPLPGWLNFNADSGEFSGEPPSGTMPALEVMVVARDSAGREASLTFRPALAAEAPAAPAAPTGERAISEPGIKPIAPEFVREFKSGGVLPMSMPDAVDRGFPVMRLSPSDAEASPADITGASSHELVIFRGFETVQADREFRIPHDAFGHTDPLAIVRLELRTISGEPIPDWLHFDASNGTIRGTPPDGMPGLIGLKLIAHDEEGREAVIEFTLELSQQSAQAPARPQPGGDEGAERELAHIEDVRPGEDEAQTDLAAIDDGFAAARDSARDVRIPLKRGAPTFGEQVRAAKPGRDPLLKAILGSQGKRGPGSSA